MKITLFKEKIRTVSYLVMARKWRPLTFEDVVNQEHVKVTLVNAIKSERIAHAFDEMQSLPGVARARWLGMIGALDLEGDAGYLARAGWRVYEEARRRGAYLRPMGNVVYVTPSLNIPDSDLDELLAIVRDSVEAAGRAG